ncbi:MULTISPECIES: hybrid sensor histidine kinase/response regulator [unclassified Achromobacter]|uniref:hybrid sensor histidine kinase/response regulator n=1 Tax=unclassified Achromobacter TaxID=2626865 RepID=UPI000B519C97|nr:MULTISPECIES: hybrid sensor histidine kinase/response regulator [unclassified Achromobacter]OWT73398.1 hybrid sensor histidine kinase/response regulator [Achromobacter sp. HZ34]OWT79686.1 hybrid sensor histidine kinase/response regulator [Achromobacter sp. HZ28]
MTENINILVVDDIAQNLVAFDALLSRPGITVLKANSGVEALELLLANEVALALVDVQMPQMNGFELAELLRGSDRTRTVPLIFLTAATHERDAHFRGYEAGAVDFMYKPIDSAVLLSKVNVFVELYTQRKQLARQLEELRQALTLNEMFTAVLGHDLRNPLSTILHGSEMLLRTSDDPTVNTNARRIQASAGRMSKMVDQLLDVARIRSNGLVLQPTQVDYRDICFAIIEEIADPGQRARVELTARGDTVGKVDADRFSQVLSNLISNALQHGTDDAPVVLDIDGSQADRIGVHVRNGGVIPPAQLPNIFNAFQASEESRVSRNGLGLGLYIVKKFVDAHGGSVQAMSAPATGTVFEIIMPRAAGAGTLRPGA